MARQVEMVIKADSTQALREIERLLTKGVEMGNKIGDTSSNGAQRAGRAWKQTNKDAFGDDAMNKIAGYAAGIASVTAAVSMLKSGWDAVNKARERYAEIGKQAEMGMAGLAQLAMGDSQKLRALTTTAKGVFASGGAGSLEEAAGLVFQLESAGAGGETDFFSSLYGIERDPAGLARAAKTLQTSVGQGETGSLRALASKAFAASAESPATGAEILTAAAGAGPGLRGVGGSDEELLAAVAIMAKATGGAAEGGTTVTSLLTSMQKQGGFEGMGLLGGIKKLKGMREGTGGFAGMPGSSSMTNAEMIKLLGRKEAFTAFDILSRNIPDIERITQDITRAEDSGLAEDIIATAERDPMISAAKKARIAKASREAANLRKGQERNVANSFIDKAMEEHEAGGGGEFAGFFKEKYLKSKQWLYGSDERAFVYSTFGKQGLEEFRDVLDPQTRDYYAAMNRNMETIANNTDDPKVTKTPSSRKEEK